MSENNDMIPTYSVASAPLSHTKKKEMWGENKNKNKTLDKILSEFNRFASYFVQYFQL